MQCANRVSQYAIDKQKETTQASVKDYYNIMLKKKTVEANIDSIINNIKELQKYFPNDEVIATIENITSFLDEEMKEIVVNNYPITYSTQEEFIGRGQRKYTGKE